MYFLLSLYCKLHCFRRNLHCWQKFYTAAGSDGMDKSHLCSLSDITNHLLSSLNSIWIRCQEVNSLKKTLTSSGAQKDSTTITINHRWTTTRTRSTCREISPLSIFPTGNFSTEGSILTSGGDHQRQPFRTKCEEPFRPFSVEVAVSFDSWLLGCCLSHANRRRKAQK